ncbi:MAG TPA: hypothetical protein VNU46_05620 [Gemmatimonadaceae bacterium]|jgi:hypothetical protein|nr:hypothetical protein [Gemmatimonadaceae bacterium]
MNRGSDFLKAQVNNAVMQHGAFVKILEHHKDQAEDTRFRDLCTRYLPMMHDHQQMLERYQDELDAGGGTLKKMVGTTLETIRELADKTRESDFLRLVGDIVMSRQSEDTFKTFREAGRQLGLTRLAQIGEEGERGHDDYNRDANRLVQQLFVEHARENDGMANISRQASFNSEREIGQRH